MGQGIVPENVIVGAAAAQCALVLQHGAAQVSVVIIETLVFFCTALLDQSQHNIAHAAGIGI